MALPLQIRAAIFDMDGTIFDTEQIYRRAWLSAGVPEPLYRSYIGTPRAYIKKLLTENGFDAEEIYRQKDAFTAAETAVHVPVKPGAEVCLAFLKEHVERAIEWCGNDERKGIIHSRRCILR